MNFTFERRCRSNRLATLLFCLSLTFVDAMPSTADNSAAPSKTVETVRDWLAIDFDHRPALELQSFRDFPLSKSESATIAKLLWDDRVQRIRTERSLEWRARKVHCDGYEMRFSFRVFGDKPPTGRRLFISMHGGGNTAPATNDRQWENQKQLYTPAEGVYLAPRAPENEWNLWHRWYIDAMFERLIADAIVFEGVDPNRVYLTGYSAGGDGVYQLAPRMADSFAAAAMMAGHPNDASPLGLRNLPFAIHVGDKDAAYNRNRVAADWGIRLDALQKADPKGYVHQVKLHAGKGHWMDRQDASAIGWMADFQRQTAPERIVWRQSSVLHRSFYWLAVPADTAKPGDEIAASVRDNIVELTSKNAKAVRVRLDDRLVDLEKPVVVQFQQKRVFKGKLPRTVTNLCETLAERDNPGLIFPSQIEVKTAD